MAGHSVEIENLSFQPPNKKKGILKDISFKISSSEFVSFIGRNGHGKSSIFRAISGELNHFRGSIKVGNNIINKPIFNIIGGIGIVHQYVQDDLIKELSILKNIQVRQLFSNDKNIRKSASDSDWLTKVNNRLSEFLSTKDFSPTNDSLVGELSGGQRQLLNILIALEFEHTNENSCKLLLLDEHLTSLDVSIQKRVMELIVKLTSGEQRPTILMITHDFQYALEYSDRIMIIYDGKIKETIKKSQKRKWNMNYLINAI